MVTGILFVILGMFVLGGVVCPGPAGVSGEGGGVCPAIVDQWFTRDMTLLSVLFLVWGLGLLILGVLAFFNKI